MLTLNGFFDWAERLPGNPEHVNKDEHGKPLVNPVAGVFLHSAEGYESTLLDLAVNGPLSWHASNLYSGRFIQHFSVYSCVWHATAANPWSVGIENEGTSENPRAGTHFEPLNDLQIANAVHAIDDLRTAFGWEARRPTDILDRTASLWEHREVTRFGGSATVCPSGRIPWGNILDGLNPPPPATFSLEAVLAGNVAAMHFFRNGWNMADLSQDDRDAIHYLNSLVP